MMQPTVLNLIQKFENLSGPLSKPRKSTTLARHKTQQRPKCKEVESVRNLNAGWQSKSLIAFDEALQCLKTKLTELNSTDEKSLLIMFIELLDLLIQVSSIDADGVKSLKIKKENCLAELKKFQSELVSLIGPEKRIDGEPSTALAIAMDDEEETVKTSKDASNSGVVLLLTKRFECQVPPKLDQLDVKFDTVSSRDGSAPCTLEEINSELDYYKEIVPQLDAEDYVKIESVEERLAFLLDSARALQADRVQDDVVVLQQRVNAVKKAHDLVLKPNPDADVNHGKLLLRASKGSTNTLKSIEQKIACSDFLNKEQMHLSAETAHPNQISSTHDSRFQTSSPTSQAVGVTIPGDDDHLRESLILLDSYQAKVKQYLQAPEKQLLEMEGAINQSYDIINAFAAHPNVEAQFKELRCSYKFLLDYITEEKFAHLYSETINNKKGCMQSDSKKIANFHNLCLEISNYYQFLDKLDNEEEMQVQVLGENLRELFDDIKQCDVSFNNDLIRKQNKALEELKILLRRVCSQQ